MARPRTERERKRRAFLQALAAGRSVSEAADHAGVAWSTLYSWRHNAAAFRAAWNRAADRARDALADRLQAALIERACVGVDEPVFHDGERVGTRRRYSDLLLLAGLRQLTGGSGSPKPSTVPKPTVTIRSFAWPEDETLAMEAPAAVPPPVEPSAAPLIDASPEPTPPAEPAAPPPDPASAPALRWDHLGRQEG